MLMCLYAGVDGRVCTHAHTRMHIHACTYTHAHTRMHTHACMRTHAPKTREEEDAQAHAHKLRPISEDGTQQLLVFRQAEDVSIHQLPARLLLLQPRLLGKIVHCKSYSTECSRSGSWEPME